MDRFTEPLKTIGIEISDLQSCLTVDQAGLSNWVRLALQAQGVHQASISLILVDDAGIRRINAEHLGHDYATDVITFPMSEPNEPELTGEIVISTETAISSSALYGVPVERELALYAVHGVLHLCGYDDQDEASRQTMEARQQEILSPSEDVAFSKNSVAGRLPGMTGGSSCPL